MFLVVLIALGTGCAPYAVAPTPSPDVPPVTPSPTAGSQAEATPPPSPSQPTPASVGRVEHPAAGADVTLPVRLLVRVGTPGQDVNVTVAWSTGEQITHTVTALRGIDGTGLIATVLNSTLPRFEHPETQPGSLQVHNLAGGLLAYLPIRILAPADPDTVEVDLYWVRDDQIVPQSVLLPRASAIIEATVEALLWGPAVNNTGGFTTRIPAPAQVLTHPGRSPAWREQPRLMRLGLVDRTAMVDFSPELTAHAGGAMETVLIREQIEATLKQFPTVDDVVISINGVTGVLDP